MTEISIDALTAADWPAARAVHEEGIATGSSTFETSAPEWDEWDEHHLRKPRLAARRAGELLGWAALSAVSDRCAYDGVAEASVYVSEAARGAGVGRALLKALIERAETEGIWTIQAGVFPENVPSLRLFETAGFRTVGLRERLGKLGGLWRDVVLLERRSEVAGTD